MAPWWYWLGWFVLGLTVATLVAFAVEARRKLGELRAQVERMQSQLDLVEAREPEAAR
jgi:hypothetical protein